jgi:hypothetical protein
MNRSKTPSMMPLESLRRSLESTVRRSALAVLLLTFAGALEAAPPELKTQGNQIVVKATGERVRLTGVNLTGLEDNLINLNLLNSIDVGVGTWKANVFRLPVKHTYWAHSTSGASYRAQVDEVVARASDLDVYVILDLHDYQKTKTAHAAFWSDAADRYKNNPAVLFGLLNEPHGIGWEVWRNGDSEGPGMQGLVAAVRATGANNIVLAGGGDWGYNLSGILNGYALTETATGNGIVYDSHVYPWKSYIQRDVGNVALVHPVLLGEFGHPGTTTYIGLGPFEAHETWVPRMLDWVNTNNLHWTGWCFSPGASPLMLEDWSYQPTVYWGEYARAHLQSYSDPHARRVVGGTVIGTPGTRSNPSSGVITDYQRGAVAPFSNTYAFFFDAPVATGGWTGLDLGAPARITRIKYMPAKKTGGGALMVGGVFQGSNTADFSSGVATLHTIGTAPDDTFVGNIGVYATASVSDTGAYRYVRYMGPAGSHSNVAAIRFYTGDDSGPDVNDDVIIIDNGGTGSEVTGSWGNAGGYGFHGTRWVSDGNTGKGTKSVRYTPAIMQDGLYEVFAIWSSHATSREDRVPYTITHAGAASPETIHVDQRVNGGSWQSLGVFPFAAGDGGNVLLSNADTDNWIVADAVKFVHRPAVDIIMDKAVAATPGIVTTGSWASSTGAPNYYGDRFFHDGNSGKGTKSVSFTPTITSPGQYAVYVWWTSHPNRATNTPITVNHAGGSAPHVVNQEQNGGQWYPLGTYTFAAGANTATGSVLIGNNANEYVVVDAVRFLRVGN